MSVLSLTGVQGQPGLTPGIRQFQDASQNIQNVTITQRLQGGPTSQKFNALHITMTGLINQVNPAVQASILGSTAMGSTARQRLNG